MRHPVQKMQRLDARPMRRVIMDTEAGLEVDDFHRRPPNCCGRITARIANWVYLIHRADWVYLMHRGRIGRTAAQHGGNGGQAIREGGTDLSALCQSMSRAEPSRFMDDARPSKPTAAAAGTSATAETVGPTKGGVHRPGHSLKKSSETDMSRGSQFAQWREMVKVPIERQFQLGVC